MFLLNPATFICILIDYSRIFLVDSLKRQWKESTSRSTAFSHQAFDRNSIRGREINAQCLQVCLNSIIGASLCECLQKPKEHRPIDFSFLLSLESAVRFDKNCFGLETENLRDLFMKQCLQWTLCDSLPSLFVFFLLIWCLRPFWARLFHIESTFPQTWHKENCGIVTKTRYNPTALGLYLSASHKDKELSVLLPLNM